MILQLRVALTTTPTLLITASGRTKVGIKDITGSPGSYIGDSSVTDLNGFPLSTSIITYVELSDGDSLYGISNGSPGPTVALIVTN